MRFPVSKPCVLLLLLSLSIFETEASSSLWQIPSSRSSTIITTNRGRPGASSLPFIIARGGSTKVFQDNDEDEQQQQQQQQDDDENDDDVIDPEVLKRREEVRKYRSDQQFLLQLRSTYLSEALAKRGLPMPTITDVSIPDGDKPPAMVDWDCALSTEQYPRGCLYSFDAEPNTKVIAPIGTTFWISLGALNRLRRTDPSKVEPLWHSQYAIHHSWFGDDSAFSILQHTGTMGFLLDIFLDKAPYLHIIIVLAALALSSPLINFSVNRLLCSPLLWNTWASWARFVHSALPLKLLLVQMTYKYVYHLLDKLRKNVRAYLVEMECANLESTVPLTTGPGSEIEEDGHDDDDGFVNHVDGVDDPFDDDDDEDEEEEEDLFDED